MVRRTNFLVKRPVEFCGREHAPGERISIDRYSAIRLENQGFGEHIDWTGGETRGDEGRDAVGGTEPAGAAPADTRVRLLKAMVFGRRECRAGWLVDVPGATARHLVNCGAASFRLGPDEERSDAPPVGARFEGPSLMECFTLGRTPDDQTGWLILPD